MVDSAPVERIPKGSRRGAWIGLGLACIARLACAAAVRSPRWSWRTRYPETVQLAASALLALLVLPALAAGADEEPSWHAQAMAHSEDGLNVTYFWSKGPRLRSETVVSGHRVVTIVNGDFYYAYDAVTRQGVAIHRAPEAIAQDSPQRRPFGRELEILLDQGAEKVGEERHHGVLCDVYRITDDAGKRVLWITQTEPRLPVRLELFSRKSGRTRYTDYLNWLSGVPLPDDFFEPEKEIHFERYSLEDYVRRTVNEGPVGPVPVLYADLLHGNKPRSAP
jgi:outer membrane lipoprotein-sorting protein